MKTLISISDPDLVGIYDDATRRVTIISGIALTHMGECGPGQSFKYIDGVPWAMGHAWKRARVISYEILDMTL